MFFRRYAHLFQWLFILNDSPSSKRISHFLAKLPKGSFVLLRAYGHADRKSLAFWLSRICKRLRLLFLVGGDPSIAYATRASGIHLRDADFCKMRKWKHISRGRWLVTSSSHSRKKNMKIKSAGFDAALFSPVFHTKNPNLQIMGPIKFRKNCSLTPKLKIFALGGISPENIWKLKQTRQKASIAGISLYNDSLQA